MTDIRASQLSTTSNLGISARSDPAGLARQIANDSRVGGRIDVDLARAKADQLAAKNPELAASIRQELESQMTPVERGQLAAAYDTPAKTKLNQSQGTLIAATPKKNDSLERSVAKAFDNLSLTGKIQDLLIPQLGKLTKAAGLGKTEWGASLQKVLDTPGSAKAFREGINEGIINGGKDMVVGIATLAGTAAQYGADKTLGSAGDALRGITGKMPGFLEAIVPSAKRGDASDAALGRLGSNIGNYVSSRSQNPNLLTSDVKNAINSAWGSLKADHAKAAAQGPKEEARWWGEVIGRVTFEVAATLVPVAGVAGKVDKAADVARGVNNLKKTTPLLKAGAMTLREAAPMLKEAVRAELAALKAAGLSNRARGPAASIAIDLKTGQWSRVHLNNKLGAVPDNLNPTLQNRLPNALKTGYEKSAGAGSHAEIYAVNELVNGGSKLSDIAVYTEELKGLSKGLQGTMKPACPHCAELLKGVTYIK